MRGDRIAKCSDLYITWVVAFHSCLEFTKFDEFRARLFQAAAPSSFYLQLLTWAFK